MMEVKFKFLSAMKSSVQILMEKLNRHFVVEMICIALSVS